MESPWGTVCTDQAPLDILQYRDVDCTLFAPYHYEPTYAYPLLVWLHGPGDDERQLRRIMPHVSLRNYVAVGPRGACPPDPGELGYQWRQTDRAVGEAERRVFRSIELACRRYHVAPDRVFVAGYQSGGTMALRIGLRHPERFAGAISIGGPFPTGAPPLARLRQARALPLLIIQGRESTLYPLEASCDELHLFHAAAMHVMLRLYPCGDELTTQMLHDMDEWIMEQLGAVSGSKSRDVPVHGSGDGLLS